MDYNKELQYLFHREVFKLQSKQSIFHIWYDNWLKKEKIGMEEYLKDKKHE